MQYDDDLMRTTLTIDDDLAAQIEELRGRKGLSFKKTVNLLLQDGLSQQAKPMQVKPYRTKTYPMGLRPGIDPTKLNQLMDELESETFLERQTGSGK
jgi:hypothetical protein